MPLHRKKKKSVKKNRQMSIAKVLLRTQTHTDIQLLTDQKCFTQAII